MKQRTTLTIITVIAFIGITTIPLTAQFVDAETLIPDWIKNNAKWWSEGTLDDQTFVNSIGYLVDNGIL